MMSRIDQIFSEFKDLGVFTGLTPELIDRFRDLAQLKVLANREALYHRGDKDRSLYAIAAGTVVVWLDGNDGTERPIHLLRRGYWLATPFTYSGEPRRVTITASGEVEIVYVSGPDFDALLEQKPELWRWLARLAANNLDFTLTIIRGLLADGALPRLAGRLASMTRGNEPVSLSQRQLALLTGLSRNTVQRTLATLEGLGAVATGYRRLSITDHALLERIAAQNTPADEAADRPT